MRVYDFSLNSMGEPTGVDSAMCVRADILEKLGHEVKLIFPVPPYPRDLMFYAGKGLRHSQMLGVHSYFSDIRDYTPTVDLQDTLTWLKEMLGCPEERYEKSRVVVKGNHGITAFVRLTPDQKGFYEILYTKDGRYFRIDSYADTIYASTFYSSKENAERYIAEEKARYFYNRDGSIALTQVFRGRQEMNVLPDGSTYNRDQLFEVFVDRLGLTKEDVVILDRPVRCFSAKPLLSRCDQTNMIAVFHSEHFYQKGLSLYGEYLSQEYWYWCRYSKYIQTMIVSTEEQKAVLEETLNENGFTVPQIQAIPVMCLDLIRRPGTARKKKSVICIARINPHKKIEWTIHTIIKAHGLDPEITLDIYGECIDNKYKQFLEKLIKDHHASEYITLKGYRDHVADIYQQYEVFLTTSLGETFGITLMEAAGSGLAIVGLDVRYGNRLFVEDGQNGYLVPYMNQAHIGLECPPETDALASRVVEIVSDEEKRRAFSERSYEIAERYLPEQVTRKWKELLAPYEAAIERM
ncbi:MAG: glycosyltransferase [Oscillibacter sp.]|nr:glycosyltransferase [uncultured Oscillibacter sp.]MCI8813610.1 glycosyltransferase [Oscillibacter sp.]